MQIVVCDTKQDLGAQAAEAGAELLRETITARGRANIVVATGASQFEMLEALTSTWGVDWSCVTAFHLDEYLGMPMSHPASFRRYLKERFVDRLPQKLAAFHYIDGEQDAAAECARLGAIIAAHPIDAAFIGIGENGHLAFNDPPADFETDAAYIVVGLDEACRRQQLGEGWFPSLEAVPTQAISMSIRQILSARQIICSVPDGRKAAAVAAAVEGPVTPGVPASILQQHAGTTLYLDRDSAAHLKRKLA
jgi:glucosamine-6-phosphate deaminase